MEQVSEIQVRRARPSDAERIAFFVNNARPFERLVAPGEVRDRFGVVGFLLAERDEDIVGLLGWQAENLVARITDFLIWPAVERLVAGRAMISVMESAARELQCEASILFLPRDCSAELLAFWETFGYKYQEVAALPKAWREAAREVRSVEEQIVMKQLREDLISRPL